MIRKVARKNLHGTHRIGSKNIKQNRKSIKLIKIEIALLEKLTGEKWTQKNKSHFPSSETTLIFRANCT
ncbi:hypothetical protein [Finegoldia magna]|uniref:hypothetical protein n=1 Tax=Finegoldia magna TaxID=1260 RepID=UPI0029161AB8|nr:hypothetical protein [Finegoldia magna]